MKEDKRAGIFPEGICFELPELYAVKVARTVLKGESGGNAADLLNQNFLLEMGKGFAFVARQQLIRTETTDFYIDLVFYNYILKCFVIIELKTHNITHQDIGQLDMYVRMYDDLKKSDGDNPTIGILLCTETDKTIAHYSVLNENKQLFATQYMNYLPTEKELADEIDRQKEILKLNISKYKEENE